MARGLAREQSKAKNLKAAAGVKKQDTSGLTPQQRNERCTARSPAPNAEERAHLLELDATPTGMHLLKRKRKS